MRHVAATRECLFLRLLLGLTLVVEGRMIPTAETNFIESCKYTWQLPGTDCWPPIGQSPRCDHLNSEGCPGSPLTAAPKTTAGAYQVEAVTTELEDPDCKPVPGRLPPIHCQNPSVQVTKGDLSHHVWTEVQEDQSDLQIHCEGCLNWPPTVTHHMNQDKMTAMVELGDPDCVPVPGRLPPIRCQNRSAQVTKGDLPHHVWTGVQDDQTDLLIHCEGCHNWPPTINHDVNQGKTTTAATMELEDPDCIPVLGRLPPIRCQNPSMKAKGGSIQTAKVIEACQYTWQLPGTDCWPPIGQSPSCDHLNSEGCRNSAPTGN